MPEPERFKPYVPGTNYWVLATDPHEYSYDDLDRDTSTVWDGVSEYVSLKNLRDVDEGDYALLLYSGDDPALVGIVRVTSDPYNYHEFGRAREEGEQTPVENQGGAS